MRARHSAYYSSKDDETEGNQMTYFNHAMETIRREERRMVNKLRVKKVAYSLLKILTALSML